MNCTKLFRQIIICSVICCLLVACGGKSGEPASDAAPPPESKPAAVAPQSGASVSAAIATGEKASSGTLSFTVSADGAAITDLSVSLKDANCSDMIMMGSVSDFMSDPKISIAGGAFQGSLPAMGGSVTDYNFNPPDPFPTPVDDPYSVGKIAGSFTTPTTASGTITIFLGAMMSGGIVCELGTFDWGAK